MNCPCFTEEMRGEIIKAVAINFSQEVQLSPDENLVTSFRKTLDQINSIPSCDEKS